MHKTPKLAQLGTPRLAYTVVSWIPPAPCRAVSWPRPRPCRRPAWPYCSAQAAMSQRSRAPPCKPCRARPYEQCRARPVPRPCEQCRARPAPRPCAPCRAVSQRPMVVSWPSAVRAPGRVVAWVAILGLPQLLSVTIHHSVSRYTSSSSQDAHVTIQQLYRDTSLTTSVTIQILYRVTLCLKPTNLTACNTPHRVAIQNPPIATQSLPNCSLSRYNQIVS